MPRPKKPPTTRLLAARVPLGLVAELEAFVAALPPIPGGRRITLSDVVRAALERGLRNLKRSKW